MGITANAPLATPHRSGKIGRAVRVSLVGLTAAIALAGCKQHLNARSVPLDGYRSKHPIIVSEKPENLDIPVGMRRLRMSAPTHAKIMAYAREAHHAGTGVVYVLVPSGSANADAARWYSKKIRSVLVAGGLSSRNIVRQGYPVDDPKDIAPIRLTYYRMTASVHECNRYPDNLASKSSNRGYKDFGCATQSNLARMVANPSDLIYPRRFDPSDPMRRSTVFDKYRAGESTATKYPEKDAGTVSDAAGE